MHEDGHKHQLLQLLFRLTFLFIRNSISMLCFKNKQELRLSVKIP